MSAYPVSIHQNILTEVGFLEQRLGYYGLLESIQKFSKENPKEIGEIFLKAAENDIFLSYPKDILNNILADVFESQLQDLGSQISNAYLRAGYKFINKILMHFESSRKLSQFNKLKAVSEFSIFSFF